MQGYNNKRGLPCIKIHAHREYLTDGNINSNALFYVGYADDHGVNSIVQFSARIVAAHKITVFYYIE
jgi:hypothetical protein